MRKIIFTKDEIENIKKMYIEEKLNTETIGLKMNVYRQIITRTLKENGIEIRNPGTPFCGGRKVSDKKWRDKPEIKERKKSSYKNWSAENRNHLREYHKKWREKNLEHLRETRNKYERTRKSNDPVYKLIGNFRTAIYTVLKENNLTKFGHYFDILGYSQHDLIDHLEKQLKDGMTWENYGEWHVDHKLPITSFNFTTIYDEEFKKCWSLENLQPMWGEENISKSNRIL